MRAVPSRSLMIVMLACGLAACASSPKKQPNDYAQLLKGAEAEVSAGRVEPALAQFNEAAKADPTRKEPWVRTAQLQFDAGNYGRAIVAAEEVLKRDPSDLVADSVLTVGGLRVAAQSLQRLRANGALESSDSARREAEQLAATMRATLGNDILASDEQKARAAAARRKAPPSAGKPRRTSAPAATTAPANEKPATGNPFEVLGGD